MSLIQNVNFKAQDNGTIDAFGRIRVSEPFTLLDTKQLFDNLPLFYDDRQISGSGTSSVHNPNRASSLMSVSPATAGVRVRQSRLRGTYQPGKSLLVLGTFIMGSPANSASIIRRTFVSGVAVDNVVLQANWNLDVMDGTGPSGIALDFTTTQILLMDLEWLGVGRVRFGFVVDGLIYYFHEINNANHLEEVYMSTPNLPIRYEIDSDGVTVKKKVGYFDGKNGLFLQCVGGTNTLEHICSSVVSEGGQQATVSQTYVSRRGELFTLANQDVYAPIFSLRLKSTHIGTRILPVVAEIMATTNVNYEWLLLINPTIAGVDTASWTPVPNSALEFDISRTALNVVTGGYPISGGYGSSTTQGRMPSRGIASSYLTIGSDINDTVDELVLAVANIDANGGTAYASMLLDEYS